jgi:hypothetical protein
LSPILVRPVREQLEHDRIIRLLQAKLKRKHDVAINAGDEQTAGIRIGAGQMYPDLILTSPDKGRRLEGIIEVETGESVNHLEAMAQWAHFGRVRAPFHLYVPASAVDIARRLCTEKQVGVAELWSYHSIGDQTRFLLVQRMNHVPPKPAAPVKAERPAAKKPAATAKPKARPQAKAKAKPSGAKKKPKRK